jgi:CubicO group peptidase (beta-lactamase class C family)
VSAALRELLVRHVDVGAIPGGVALLGAGNARVITAGMASVGSGPMGEDAIMRIQSMTKAITSVAALRLVEAGRLELDQSLVDWLPELADRQVLRRPAAELDDTAGSPGYHASPPPDQYLRIRHGDPGFATAAGDGRERH